MSYPDPLLNVFDGAIIVRRVEQRYHPSRAFAFHVTFLVEHPLLVALAARKPPLHFHPHQEEYIEVLEGTLAVEVEGKENILTRGDGEFRVPPWTNHRLYTPAPAAAAEPAAAALRTPGEGDKCPPTATIQRKTRFLLSGDQTSEVFKLDTVFFQNWYGYQNEMVESGKEVDLLQVMCMFDAGGSYLALPRWVPLSRPVAQALGIIVGRWVAPLLGYQPFHQRWTTDWALACEKMETSLFLRRFAARSKTE